MDATLKEWLHGRGVAEKTVRILEEEEIVSTDVFTQLREEDLTALKSKHGLTLGEHVRLRESRDALQRGEHPTQGSDVTLTEGGAHEKGAERGVEPVLLPQSALRGGGEEGGPSEEKQKDPKRSKSKPQQTQSTAHSTAPTTTGHTHRFEELNERATEVEKLQQEGHLQEATQRTKALAKDTQHLVEEIREDTAAPDPAGNMDAIDKATKAFDGGTRSGLCPCCVLL